MDFAESLRTAVRHLTRKTRFHGFYLYRVISETARDPLDPGSTRRLTLQVVTKADGLRDQLLIDKAHGSPAISEACAPGSLVLVGFQAGDPGQPYVGFYLPSTPLKAALDASTEIRIGASLVPDAPIILGSATPQPIALAPATVAAIQALATYAAAVAAEVPALASALSTLNAALSPLLGSGPTGITSARTSSE